MKLFKIFISVVAFIMFLHLSPNVISQTGNMPLKEGFHLGTFNFPMYGRPDNWMYNDTQMNRYGELNLNTIMLYNRHRESGDYNSVGFYDTLPVYYGNLNSMNNKFYGKFGERKVIIELEKILRPAFGQRSDYQAETRDINGKKIVDKRPGYGYTNTDYPGNDVIDNWGGEIIKAKRCVAGVDGAGYITNSLYENLEQVNYPKIGYLYYSDMKDLDYRWFVKPRMRIPDSIANNPQMRDTKVVKIEIINFKGSLIKTIIINAGSFKKKGELYSGRYLENYFDSESGLPLPYYVLAGDLCEDATPNNFWNSKVDYRIFWYGTVTVWLDYVRLDDEWAHALFEPQIETESFGKIKYNFREKIQQDMYYLFTGNTSFAYARGDEMLYNSIPCIRAVDSIMKSINPYSGFIASCYDWSLQGIHRNTPDFLNDGYEFVIQMGMNDDILEMTTFPFQDCHLLPPGLSLPDKDIYPGTFRYHRASSNNEYNDTIQRIYSESYFAGGIARVYRSVSDMLRKQQYSEVIYSPAIQLHSFEEFLTGNINGTVPREPTNEEISLQCYLSLAYGAKMLQLFMYNSGKIIHDNKSYFNWGLLDENNINIRENNYYGQKKWDSIVNLTSKLRAIGNILYPDGEISKHLKYKYTAMCNGNYSGFSLPYDFLVDIFSYNGYNGNFNWSDTNTLQKDLPKRKYWDIGFFEDLNNANNKYFLCVNKFCAPLSDRVIGDIRTVKLIIDKTKLLNFNEWELKDMLTGEKIIFDKNTIESGIYYPYPFQPGEGKLFKLTPVIQ